MKMAPPHPNLVQSLHHILLRLHHSPYPHVPNPDGCEKRASVAVIIRVRPSYQHQLDASANRDGEEGSHLPTTLDGFFAQSWVQEGDPEILFIKRVGRVGDRWSGHVALPGGKRDPEDENDAVRFGSTLLVTLYLTKLGRSSS